MKKFVSEGIGMTALGWIMLAVSSSAQVENVSLENQAKMGMEAAAKHDVQIVGAVVIPGKSRHIVLFDRAASTVKGYKLDAQDLQRLSTTPLVDIMKEKETIYPYAELLEILEAKPPAKDTKRVLFFLNRSRLGRTAALSMAIIGLCRENHVKPYDLESPPVSLDITSSRDEAYVGAFKSTEAENQIWTIQENHRKGMIRRVEKHGKMPGKINFGYVPIFEHGTLTGYTIDEEAAETVRLIVDLYLNRGLGAMNIADHLNRLGRVAPKGGLWGHSQITFLLRRIWRYAGYAELNVYSATGRPYVRSRGIWDAIITEEVARRVVAERASRNDSRRSVHTTYRFTMMVYCGVCGSRFHSQTKYRDWVKADGSPGHYEHVSYKCPAEHGMIGEKKIVKAVAAYIGQLDDESFRAGILKESESEPSAEIMEEIEELQTHLGRLNEGIARADNDYYVRATLDEERHSAIVAGIKRQTTAIMAEITTLQDKLHDAEQSATFAQRVDDMRLNGLAYIKLEDVRTANAWLRTRFRVVVEKRQVVDVGVVR
jgi:DNA invertase Pin-like site-specific DNA recombinase